MKEKIYLDTSVISHLTHTDTPEKMTDTICLWDIIKSKNRFSAIVSNITLEEIEKCDIPKKDELFEYLSQIDFENYKENSESLDLVEKYLSLNVLPAKCRDDLRHIALATILQADYIVSWNFKHFVNIKIINKIQAVNKLYNYKEIIILPPSMLLEEEI